MFRKKQRPTDLEKIEELLTPIIDSIDSWEIEKIWDSMIWIKVPDWFILIHKQIDTHNPDISFLFKNNDGKEFQYKLKEYKRRYPKNLIEISHKNLDLKPIDRVILWWQRKIYDQINENSFQYENDMNSFLDFVRFLSWMDQNNFSKNKVNLTATGYYRQYVSNLYLSPDVFRKALSILKRHEDEFYES